MRLKVKDLAELMAYLEKEDALYVDVSVAEMEMCSTFSFVDCENRECDVKIYQVKANKAPHLTKTMPLRSRVGSPKTKKSSGD